MAHLDVFKQQEALPVQFQWHRQTREVIPLVGQAWEKLSLCELHKGMVAVAFSPSGLRKEFWIVGIL